MSPFDSIVEMHGLTDLQCCAKVIGHSSRHCRPLGPTPPICPQRYWPALLENRLMALWREQLELSVPWQHYWALETDCLNLAVKEISYRGVQNAHFLGGRNSFPQPSKLFLPPKKCAFRCLPQSPSLLGSCLYRCCCFFYDNPCVRTCILYPPVLMSDAKACADHHRRPVQPCQSRLCFSLGGTSRRQIICMISP